MPIPGEGGQYAKTSNAQILNLYGDTPKIASLCPQL